jgi:arylsulfatase
LSEGFDHIDNNTERFEYPFSGMKPDIFMQESSRGVPKLEYLRSCLESEEPVRSLLNGASNYLDERGYAPGLLSPKRQCPARGHVNRFLEWSASVNGEWAACINFITTHHDYTPLPEYDLWADQEVWDIQDAIEDQHYPFWSGRRPWSEKASLMDLYDGAIRQVDQAVKYLYEQLESRGNLNDTVLIFTSDHGEGFGERSEVR